MSGSKDCYDSDPRVEAATQAVYDCELGYISGDTLAEILHDSDYIDASLPIENQLEQVKALCRLIARAALDAADKTRSISNGNLVNRSVSSG